MKRKAGPGPPGLSASRPIALQQGGAGADATVLDLELDPYTILNFSTGITLGAVEVIAFANNLTDENANLAFDRERGGRARLGFHTNQPRTYGLTARIRF